MLAFVFSMLVFTAPRKPVRLITRGLPVVPLTTARFPVPIVVSTMPTAVLIDIMLRQIVPFKRDLVSVPITVPLLTAILVLRVLKFPTRRLTG